MTSELYDAINLSNPTNPSLLRITRIQPGFNFQVTQITMLWLGLTPILKATEPDPYPLKAASTVFTQPWMRYVILYYIYI